MKIGENRVSVGQQEKSLQRDQMLKWIKSRGLNQIGNLKDMEMAKELF